MYRKNLLTLISGAILSMLCLSCSVDPEPSDIPRDAVLDGKEFKENKTFVKLKSGAIVENCEGRYIYSGDVALSKHQFDLLNETGSIFDNHSFKVTNKGIRVDPMTGYTFIETSDDKLKAFGRNPNQGMFWAMVRYTFSNNLTESQKETILEAIKIIEKETNARFYDANGKPTKVGNFIFPYIEFNYHKSKNDSNIGRIGGRQVVNIHNFYIDTIIHEICHALGMFHEHSRHDRDRYININLSNLADKASASNFIKESTNYYSIGAFDFESIMLYGSYDGALNLSKPVMTKKDGTTFSGGKKLSESDRLFINRFYLPYVSKGDGRRYLDSVMFSGEDNRRLSKSEISRIESELNRY